MHMLPLIGVVQVFSRCRTPRKLPLPMDWDGTGQNDIGFKSHPQLFKNNRQRKQDTDAQRIVQNSRPGNGIFFDGIIENDVLYQKTYPDGPQQRSAAYQGRFPE